MNSKEIIWYRCLYCSFACSDCDCLEKHVKEAHPEVEANNRGIVQMVTWETMVKAEREKTRRQTTQEKRVSKKDTGFHRLLSIEIE